MKFGNPIATVAITGTVPISGTVDSNVTSSVPVQTTPTANQVISGLYQITTANAFQWILNPTFGVGIHIFSLLCNAIPSGNATINVQQGLSLTSGSNVLTAFVSGTLAPVPFIIPPSGLPMTVGNGLKFTASAAGFYAVNLIYTLI